MRRNLGALLALLGALCVTAASAVASTSAPVFIVDLDGTLVQTPVEGETYAGDDLVSITLDGDKDTYRIVNGARELIESLSKIPGARIYFFSGGTEDRNLALLKSIKMADGSSILDHATGLFSRHNLTSTATGPVKDVSRLVPGFDPGQTVFLDDIKPYMAPDARRNLIELPGHEKLLAHAKELASADTPRKAGLYFAKRNQLIASRGLIDRALAKADAKGITLVDALRSLGADASALDKAANYSVGLARLREINPALKLVEVPGAPAQGLIETAQGLACYRNLAGLLRNILPTFH